MNHFRRQLLIFMPLLLMLCLFANCATPPSASKQIDLFRDGQQPSRPFKEIRMLSDDGGLGEQGEIEGKFITQAKRLGADALILHPSVKTGGELKGFAIVTTYLFKASVIVYDPAR